MIRVFRDDILVLKIFWQSFGPMREAWNLFDIWEGFFGFLYNYY